MILLSDEETNLVLHHMTMITIKVRLIVEKVIIILKQTLADHTVEDRTIITLARVTAVLLVRLISTLVAVEVVVVIITTLPEEVGVEEAIPVLVHNLKLFLTPNRMKRLKAQARMQPTINHL